MVVVKENGLRYFELLCRLWKSKYRDGVGGCVQDFVRELGGGARCPSDYAYYFMKLMVVKGGVVFLKEGFLPNLKRKTMLYVINPERLRGLLEDCPTFGLAFCVCWDNLEVIDWRFSNGFVKRYGKEFWQFWK